MTTSLAKSVTIKRAGGVVFVLVTLVLALYLVVQSLAPAYNVQYYFNELSLESEVSYSVNGEPKGMLSLPATLGNLEAGDVVSVTLAGSGRNQDSILLELDHASCTLYVDDRFYYSLGNEGTFPSFQKEPPRSLEVIPLPSNAVGNSLRIDYLVSGVGHDLALSPYISGDQNLIMRLILFENYITLVLSLIMIIVGITLAIVGLVFAQRAELPRALFWLGLECFLCGIWTFFSNDVVLVFFTQFSVFYTIAHLSLYLLPIPLARFCLIFVRPHRSRLLIGIFLLCCVFFLATVASHLSGFISFGQVFPYFQVACPLLLFLYLGYLIGARRRYGLNLSPLFMFCVVLLAVLCLFEVVSGYLGIKSVHGTYFMVGLLFATVVVSLLIWEYLNHALDAAEKNARLEADISAVNRSLDLQRKHFQDFTASIEETRRMRHDLRHQLVALQGYIAEERHQEALAYIDTLTQSMPSVSAMLICDNLVVNSLAAHYLAQARSEGIFCDVKMVVPAEVGCIPNSDLSIIVGNLFENAIEACRYVEPEKRFIRVRATTTAKRLTLVIDNSFDGEVAVRGDSFYSRKRKGYGVGIASVRQVVARYGGSMRYNTEPGVFKTSLFVKI